MELLVLLFTKDGDTAQDGLSATEDLQYGGSWEEKADYLDPLVFPEGQSRTPPKLVGDSPRLL